MDRNQKAAVIDEVAAQIEESEAVFAVDYRGISVPQAAELRTALRGADASFRVVKNTLTERAADKAGADGLKGLLEGPTAMAFVRGDAAAAAKALNDFARKSGILAFKGGWMNGQALSADEIVSISRLPSREVLYAQLVGMVASPITGLATAMSNLISGLGRQLQQIHDQGLVGGTAAPAPAAEAPAEEAPAEEPAGAQPASPASTSDQDAEPPVQPESTDAPAEGADTQTASPSGTGDTPSTETQED